ncbi:MAG TPA: flagellar basal body-associated FliL family protein [Polyangiaceae bacterium]|jgi:flagellar basal body-associated protein FliL|nr:flagellar basal body-associated FliL family protein [Polyangiaceae bacterium]
MEHGAEPEVAPVEKKKSKGPLIGILVAAVLVLGAGAAGAVMGPRFFPKPTVQPKHDDEAQPEDDKTSAEDKAPEDDKAADDKATDDSSGDGDEKHVEIKAGSGDVKDITNLAAIVVDTRSADGQVRHLKIALSIEHPEGVKEADFKSYVPRAREAAIWYLRTHDFEELSAPKNFDKLRKELNDNIIAAVGKKRARRVLITDFVAQ